MIAAWVTDPLARQRLAAAIREEHRPRRSRRPTILWCDSGEEVTVAVATRGATPVIIELAGLGPPDAASTSGSDITRIEALTRTLRDQHPAVPVLLYAPLTAAASRAVVTLARAGATNVIIAGHDDLSHSVAPILARAASICAAEDAYRKLSAVASPAVAAILNYALRYGARAPTVADAAAALHVHRKTLSAWCHSSGAPSPRVLVTWCRLIIAVERLADARWPAERVARVLGFGSGSALAGLIRRHIGLSRTALREQGSSAVVEMLVRRLAEGRDRIARADSSVQSPRARRPPRRQS
jgi:AraC-like DNA-binding protein